MILGLPIDSPDNRFSVTLCFGHIKLKLATDSRGEQHTMQDTPPQDLPAYHIAS
jgi:hypothetical protein